METVREYIPTADQRRNIKATGYSEINYIDRYTDGTPAGEGTEDFSADRWRKCTASRYIYQPTGKLDKGGHRRWECIEGITARTVRECGIIARLRYTGQEISVRQY